MLFGYNDPDVVAECFYMFVFKKFCVFHNTLF